MSLFQCENCGCCENTALSAQGFQGLMAQYFDWKGLEQLEGKRVCSACGPTHYRDGEPTKFGRWHDEFTRVYLPMGMFITNDRGDLAHAETGATDFLAYAIEREDAQ